MTARNIIAKAGESRRHACHEEGGASGGERREYKGGGRTPWCSVASGAQPSSLYSPTPLIDYCSDAIPSRGPYVPPYDPDRHEHIADDDDGGFPRWWSSGWWPPSLDSAPQVLRPCGVLSSHEPAHGKHAGACPGPASRC